MALVFVVFESLQGWDGWGQAGPRASDLLLRHPGGPLGPGGVAGEGATQACQEAES